MTQPDPSAPDAATLRRMARQAMHGGGAEAQQVAQWILDTLPKTDRRVALSRQTDLLRALEGHRVGRPRGPRATPSDDSADSGTGG